MKLIKKQFQFKYILITLALLSSCNSISYKFLQKNSDDSLRPFLGFELENQTQKLTKNIQENEKIHYYSTGISIKFIFPFSPADKMGLKNQDIIYKINQKSLSELEITQAADLTQYIAVQKINSPIQFSIIRNQDYEHPFHLSANLIARQYSFGSTQYTNQNQLLRSQLEFNKDNSIVNDIENKIKAYHLENDSQDLFNRFKKLSYEGDSLRLPLLKEIQRQPLSFFSIHQNIENVLHQNKSPLERWNQFASLLYFTNFFDKENTFLNLSTNNQLKQKYFLLLSDFNKRLKSIKKNSKTSSIEEYYLIIKTSNKMIELAYDDFSESEIIFLKNQWPILMKKMTEFIYIQYDDNLDKLNLNLKTLELMQKIHPEFIHLAYAVLTTHLTNDLFKKIQIQSQKLIQSEKQKIINLSNDKILISNIQNDVHSQSSYFTIIDLGGNDQYQDFNGQIIDFSGNDIYGSSQSQWSMAASIISTKTIYDFAGNDLYRAYSGAFGSTLGGIAILNDQDGDDDYRCVHYCNGIGVVGLGASIDHQGHDNYSALQFSQGVGIAGGFGILDDENGNDFYYSAGEAPSGYGDFGQFQGWSQGVGLGFRGFVSGGVGILYDKKGRDHFESGDFSQGGGYYFGWGLLINDDKDNDFYLASRYSQGFTAHYALGSFIEYGGDDHYTSKHVVGQGMSWDLGITFFNEKNGDDKYKTCAHCLGTASQSGLTYFLDEKGTDSYQGTQLPYSEKVDNSYHSGISLGFFTDLGREQDSYEKFKNEQVILRDKFQIIEDK